MGGTKAIGLFIDDVRQWSSLNTLFSKDGKHFSLYRIGDFHERPKKSSGMEHWKLLEP